MYIVVVVNQHYPSVLHFKDRSEAIEKYEEYKEQGYVIHLAQVETSHFNTEDFQFQNDELRNYKEDIDHIPANALDVEWYL